MDYYRRDGTQGRWSNYYTEPALEATDKGGPAACGCAADDGPGADAAACCGGGAGAAPGAITAA